MTITLLKAGLLSSLQDGGRRGYAALGVGRAGAMDRPAWRLANALVGNPGGEAALEFTLLGPTLRFEQPAVIALTGAPFAAEIDGQPFPTWACCQVPAGSVLRIGAAAQGCRGYLAVRGGFDAVPLLGSRSSDLHASLGRALRDGEALTVTSQQLPAGSVLNILPWRLDPAHWFDPRPRPLALMRGSHFEQLDEVSRHGLYEAGFSISKDANRTAARLDGPRLGLRQPLELISEATLPGTLQLPPSGQPIVLLSEAPVTGGYPRIGQLAAVDLPRLAQRRPGDAVHFVAATMEECLQRLAAREQALERQLAAIAARLQSP